MRNSLFIVVFISLYIQGCVMIKTGGVKSTAAHEVSSTPTGEVQILSLADIEPQLTTEGTLSLWVSGEGEKKINVTQRVVEYGDEWMAIGFFPGYDIMTNVQKGKNGKTLEPGAYGFFVLFSNVLLVGIPTMCSMFEVLSPDPVRLRSGVGAGFPATAGIIGTLKYEGSKYEIRQYPQENPKYEKHDWRRAPVLLKGYRIAVDGVVLSDIDGVINIRRKFKDGDQIHFKITSIGSQHYLGSILNVEFLATCR